MKTSKAKPAKQKSWSPLSLTPLLYCNFCSTYGKKVGSNFLDDGMHLCTWHHWLYKYGGGNSEETYVEYLRWLEKKGIEEVGTHTAPPKSIRLMDMIRLSKGKRI